MLFRWDPQGETQFATVTAWEANIIEIRRESGSLAVISTFLNESNCHSIQPIVTYMKGKKCVPNYIARFCKEIKHFMAVHGESLKRLIFAVL